MFAWYFLQRKEGAFLMAPRRTRHGLQEEEDGGRRGLKKNGLGEDGLGGPSSQKFLFFENRQNKRVPPSRRRRDGPVPLTTCSTGKEGSKMKRKREETRRRRTTIRSG